MLRLIIVGRPLVSFAVTLSLLVSPVGIPTAAAAATHAPKLVDSCLSFRKPFERIKNYQLNKILTGVVGGAFLGGLAGLLKDQIAPQYERDSQGNVKKKSSVVAGMVEGAAAGGLIGWFSSLKKTAQNQEELQGAVNASLHQDVDQFSPLGESLADLGNCRRTQIFEVQQAYQRHEIDAKTAGKQLDTLDKWIARDDQIISSASKMHTKTIGAYASATAMADGQNPDQVKASGDQVLSTMEAQSTSYAPQIVESYSTPGTVEPAAPPPPPPTETRYIKALQSKGVSLRSEASPDATALVFLPNGTSVETSPSPTEGWLGVTAGDAKGYIKESLLSLDPPSARRSTPPKPRPAPVAPKPKPKPGTAVQKLAYVPSQRQPVKARDQVKVAAANLSGMNTMIARDSQATSDQMRAARLALES